MRKFQLLSEEEDLKAKLEEADLAKLDLITQRNQVREDLKNVENAFSDLHKKYERAKGVLENFKKNEDIMRKRDDEMQERVNNRNQQMEELKEQVQETLERMYHDYQVKAKEMESDIAKLRVLLRKAEMKADTLQNESEQKSREIQKLVALCDELVSGNVK